MEFGTRNVQEEESAMEVAGYPKKIGFASTKGQEYEVALLALFFLRALRHASEFFLASNHDEAGKFDDVVLFYRLKGDQGHGYRAILLQAKHKSKVTEKQLTYHFLFRFKEYLESFKKIRNLWTGPVRVGNLETNCQEIVLVLYTNTGCESDEAAVDVTESQEVQHLRDVLNTGGRLLRITEAQKVGLPEDEETSDFLAQLLLCTQQASIETVDSFLEEDLRDVLKLTSTEVTRNLNSELKHVMKAWWNEEGRVSYLSGQSEKWYKFLEKQMGRLNEETLKVYRRLNLDFTQAAIEEFSQVQMKMAWIRVRDVHQAKAVKSRMFRAQSNSLVVDVEQLITAFEEIGVLWGSNISPALVVDMSAVSPEEESLMLQRLLETLQSDAARRLVIISRENPPDAGWSLVAVPPTWSVVHQATRDRLMDTKVMFQGRAVQLRDIVASHDSDVMSDDVISAICESEAEIQVGDSMPAPLDYYVTRCVQREPSEKIDVERLQNIKKVMIFPTYISPNNEFTKKLKTLTKFQINKVNEIIDPTIVAGVSNHYNIRQLCCRFQVQGISGQISMKRLKGNVKEFLPFPWNCEAKVVVIEGLPGVGKSSYVTMMCSRVKEQFPETWVLRLDMGQHTDHIKNTDFAEVSDIKGLLLKSLRKDLTGLERRLLEHSLTVTGNVFLFLDAFDEISPDYTRQCCQLIKGIAQKMRYRQLVVTTRPVTTRNVEEELQARAFSLPVFCVEDQVLFLKQFSAARGTIVNEEEISSLYQTAGTVLQIPLLCRMAAEVLVHRNEQRLHQFGNPWRRVLLYELFVEQSVTKRVAAKLQLDTSKPVAKTMLESNKTAHLKNLQGLAVRQLMPVDKLPPFSVSMVAPEEKLGLVVNTEGRVDFEHKTFAEYFLGCWLACHWRQCPRELLHDVFFRAGFELAAATFSWSLFEGFPLHVAVAQGDEEAVRALLAPGTTDRGGRTALHVAAMTQGDHRRVWELLVASGEDLNKKDNVLQTSSIRYASIASNWEFVNAFVEKKGNIQYNVVGNEHMKDLIHAVRKDLTGICEAILHKQNGNFYQFDDDGNTLLHLAAASNSIKVMKLLIKIRHKLNVRNKKGYTPLHVALELRNMKVVRLLVESGADLNVKNDEGDTPLMDAAHEGHLEAVKLFLENGAYLNVTTDNGFTALTLAAAGGHPEVVKLLIEKGGDLNMTTNDGFTALMEAAGEGHLEVVKFLLENGADLNMKTDHGFTALTLTVLKGHLQVVKLLLENGADLNVKTEGGDSALTWAAYEGHLDVVKVLLEYGPNLNITADYGDTALMLAARQSHLEVVKVLLDKGADVNIKNTYGDTALTWAALEGHLLVVKVLLRKGADSNMKTESGQTALMVAARGGHLDVMKILIEKGDDLNTKADNGFTALMLAAREGYVDVVKMLVKNGADVNAKNMKEESALMLAAREGHLDILEFLKTLK